MNQYTFEAMTEPKIIESDLGFTDNHDGTFTVTVTQQYQRKNDRTIEMKFTRNGLAAIAGTLRFLIGEDGEDDGTAIHKTETGRRWLVKKFDTWSCGYIEIDNNMPKDYLNEFYEQFPFYMGATFMGMVFPNLVGDGRALLGSPDFLLGAEPDKSPIERTIISFRPEFRDVVRQAIKDGNCFWAVGFDDNHIDRIGYEEMVFTTERIANQIDQVVISGGTDAEGR